MKYLLNVYILEKFCLPQVFLISVRTIKMVYPINVIQKTKRISLHTNKNGVLTWQQVADIAVQLFVLK